MAKKNINAMSFLDHLEDLRWHLIRAIISVFIAAILAFICFQFIFDTVIFGPTKMSFPTYKWLCETSQFLGFNDVTFCADKLPIKIINRDLGGQFSAHIWTSIYTGLIIAFPYVLYQLWAFISPGLQTNERKNSRGFIFISSLLFFIGILFGYYVITPLAMSFLATYTVTSLISNDIDFKSVISLVRSSSIAAGFVFELPIIVYFFTKIGLITPNVLRKQRKIALVIVLILSAIITPPDVTSQVIVAIPILILYQISIYISALVVRSQKRKQKQG